MLFDPVDRHILDLPFVNALDGTGCRTIIHQALKASEEQLGNDITTELVVLLHLHTNSGRQVLLEMAVSIVTLGCERYAVLTGREVNSELATLMGNEGTTVSGASSSVSWGSDRCYKPERAIHRTMRSPSLDVIETSDSAKKNPTPFRSPDLCEAFDSIDERNRSDSGSWSATTSMRTAVMKTIAEDLRSHGTDTATDSAISLASSHADNGGEAHCTNASGNVVDAKDVFCEWRQR